MDFTFTFIRVLFLGLYLTLPVLLLFGLIMISLGQMVGRIERWTRLDALYWSFITALTVGYGDIRPSQPISKLLAILLTLAGIMFSGIIVAITVSAGEQAFKLHIDISQYQ